jgi:hypothetical protein
MALGCFLLTPETIRIHNLCFYLRNWVLLCQPYPFWPFPCSHHLLKWVYSSLMVVEMSFFDAQFFTWPRIDRRYMGLFHNSFLGQSKHEPKTKYISICIIYHIITRRRSWSFGCWKKEITIENGLYLRPLKSLFSTARASC